MITVIVVNGEPKLVLAPSNSAEKAFLDDLFSKPVVVTLSKTVQVLDKNYPDAYIVSQSKKEKESGSSGTIA